MNLGGRLALVTGASTGIGAATARALAGRGARVALVARSADKLESLAAQIGEGALACPTDGSDHHAVAQMAERIRAEEGVPDVLVNNAGTGRFLFIEETSPEELGQMTAVPYHAAFFVTRAFIVEMFARRSGRIVNVSTPVAYAPGRRDRPRGRRWAMRGFTEALRADLHRTGVGVTLVVPGKVSSEYFTHNPGAEARIPKVARLMRTRTPEQTAEAIVRAIERERAEVIVPVELRALMLQSRVAEAHPPDHPPYRRSPPRRLRVEAVEAVSGKMRRMGLIRRLSKPRFREAITELSRSAPKRFR